MKLLAKNIGFDENLLFLIFNVFFVICYEAQWIW